MSLRLKLYLSAVALAAIVLLVVCRPPDLPTRWVHYVAWTLVCFISESLWLRTFSGGGTTSMASTANLATVMLWGRDASMWIVSISTLLANFILQKKPWERAVFNASQITVTMWAAGTVFFAFGGLPHGLQGQPMVLLGGSLLVTVLAFLGLVITYTMVNRALVSLAVAWSSGRQYWAALREDWFYRDRLFDDLALFLLSPLVVICFEAIRSAQQMLIHSERMAAKGEIAAEIGHGLRNQLVAISGRAQMLIKDAERQQFGNVGRHSQIILEQAHRVEAMSKGLMDFSRAEFKIERVDLNALVQRSVEFVRPQNRFDPIEWDLRLATQVPELRADPGQLQQVLLNLFINAADAMADPKTGRRVITVRTDYDERGRHVRLVVGDSGPGIAASLLPRVFEPHFTTKAEGHGFGLSTVAESDPGQGARFTITLPLDGPAGWS
ncbi:MAG: hypothetical protein E6K80_00815 [Candidatus Eisenbacteria bacterium]|uniref:histidine kinase n=1 Tax=Eiseniibacteriota bacterium TaxID=2212470 RepID=A0A538UBF2_UNCEI|nr:MAG: hypothetical protein E6K80_00815 [Candidatus Eisenbacteria bacterium]